MIFLCHGLAKSASSFAYHLASASAERAGFIQAPMLRRYLPAALVPHPPQPYFIEPFAGALSEVAAAIPAEEILVVKLHSPLHPDIKDLLQSDDCMGLCTYRDPRDAAVSLYEAAQRERRKNGKDQRKAFTEIQSIERCIDIIKRRFDDIQPWLQQENILPIAYQDLRIDPLGQAQRLSRHMGLCVNSAAVVAAFVTDKRRIREFNVGNNGRFKTVLSHAQETAAQQACAGIFDSVTNTPCGIYSVSRASDP